MRFLPKQPTPNQKLLIACSIAFGVLLIAGITTYGALIASESLGSESLAGMLLGLLSLSKQRLATQNKTISNQWLFDSNNTISEPTPAPADIHFILGPTRPLTNFSAGMYPLADFITLSWKDGIPGQLIIDAQNSTRDSNVNYFFDAFNNSLPVTAHGDATEINETLEPKKIVLCLTNETQSQNIVALSGTVNFPSGKRFAAEISPFYLAPPERLQLPSNINCLTPCTLNEVFNSSEVALNSFTYEGVQPLLVTSQQRPYNSVTPIRWGVIQLKFNNAPAGLWQLTWQQVCGFKQTIIVNSVEASLKIVVANLQPSDKPQRLLKSLKLTVAHPNRTLVANLEDDLTHVKSVTVRFSFASNMAWHLLPTNATAQSKLSSNNKTLEITAPIKVIEHFMQHYVQFFAGVEDSYDQLTTQFTIPDFNGTVQQVKLLHILKPQLSNSYDSKIDGLKLAALVLLLIILGRKQIQKCANYIGRLFNYCPPVIDDCLRQIELYLPRHYDLLEQNPAPINPAAEGQPANRA